MREEKKQSLKARSAPENSVTNNINCYNVTGVNFWICTPLVTLGVTVVFLISGVAVVCSVCAGNSLLLRGCSGWENLGARPWKKVLKTL